MVELYSYTVTLRTNTTVDNCIFKNNTAEVNGGGVDWQDGAHNGRLTNSIFINNTAWRSGGAAYWNGYNGTMINCSFTDNRAVGNWSGTVPAGVVIVTDTIISHPILLCILVVLFI